MIREIIFDHFGFRIWLQGSGQIFTFFQREIDKKNELINAIRTNAKRYMDTEIHVTGSEHTSSSITSRVSELSRNNVFMMFDAFRINYFGDFIDCKVGLNAQSLIEIIDGRIQNKLAVEGITQIVRESDNCCQVRIQYGRNDFAIYILRPEDYDSFISNLLFLLEDIATNRLEHQDSMTIMEERVAVYALVDYKPVNQSVPINGLIQSATIDDYFLANIDVKADVEKFLPQLIELISNSMMKNEFNFTFLLEKICAAVTEISMYFEHPSFIQIVELMRDHREEVTRIIFKNMHEKNSIIVNPSKAKATGDSLAEMVAKLESKNREVDKRIAYFTTRAKQFEQFLSKKEVIKNIELFLKMLDFLTICTNNSFFFKEISLNVNIKKTNSVEAYKMFMRSLVKLSFQNYSRLVSHSALNFLHKFMRNIQPTFNKNAEAMNKDLLLSQKVGLTFARDAISFLGNFCLLTAKDQIDKIITKNSTVIYDILRIFEAIINDRRDTTIPENLVVVLKWLSNHVAFSIMKTLMRSQSQCVIFRTLMLMNCIFQGMGSRENVAEYQRLILNHSTLVLRNIELLLMPVSKRQKQISVVFLYNCLNNEPSAASLMTRMIPKSLFRKVDSTSNDISKWTLIQWEELFGQINSNFSTAIEQWNDECRTELQMKLRQAQNDYDDHWQVLDQTRFILMLEAIAKSRDGQLESTKSNSLLQLRWNFEEYEVKYGVLEKQLPVWKYYIEQLYEETAKPTLNIVINNAKKLWEELSIQLISREDTYTRKKILQTMILVYKEYFEKIKELNLIPYLIKVLAQEEDDTGSFHYLILQLLFTSMDINNNMISHQNIRKFNEKGGLQVIRAHLAKNYYFDNLDEIDYESIRTAAIERAATRRGINSYAGTPLMSRAISQTHISRGTQKETITYNFSSAELPREAYSPILKKSNEILICLNIIKVCIARTKSQSEDLMLFPRPLARQMVSEKETINLLNQLLLIRDSTIVAIVQEIINLAYFNRFSYKQILVGTNYYERSIYGIHNISVGEIVARNFRDLFFLVQNDATEDIKKLLGRFATFGYLDSDLEETESEKERILKDKLFELYPLFKTLPWQMIYILVRKGGPEEFVRNFYDKKFEHPRLLWTEDMRYQLLGEMKEKFKGEFDRLKANHEKFINGKLSMGIFEPLFQPSRIIEYKAVLKELVCDNVFLRIWVLPDHDDFDLEEAQVPRIFLKLNRMLDKKVDTLINDPNIGVAVSLIEKVKEVYTILKANLKIIKKYTIPSENQLATFHKILELWSGYVFDTVSSENSCTINLWELVIKNTFKIVSLFLNRASKENVEDFRKCKNIRTSILRVTSLIVNKILHENWCSFNFLRILSQYGSLLKGLQMNMVNLVEMFQDVDTENTDIYDICTLLNFSLHLYHLYFYYMMLNNYSIIFENHRLVPTEVIKQSIYVVYEMKDIVDNRDTIGSPRRETQYGPQYQMDPALTNIIDYFKQPTFVTGFNFEVEDRLLRMTADLLDVIVDLCETPTCATYLVKSKLFYRLFQIGIYYIPREIRSSPESAQDSCFQLIDNFKTISDLGFKALIHLTIMFLEGSINAGTAQLDDLLKDIENTAFNKIKENADTIRFEDNKKLEDALVSARRFLGDNAIRGLIAVYLEPDRVDLFRDDLISAPDNIQERRDSISGLHRSQTDKLRIKVSETTENIQSLLEIIKKTPISKNMALERRSIVQNNSSDLTIRGVVISSYVHNPFHIDNPSEFVNEASERILGQERKSHQNLVFLLKAINCIIRDEPDFEISQLVVDRLILLYSQVEVEWGDIRNLIADLFYALSILMINLKREASWVSSLSFNRLILKNFLDYNSSQSEEAYQLMIKWAHVVSQVINTEHGMKAISSFNILLGLSKIVFESTFPIYIRYKMAESIMRLYTMQGCPAEYRAMLDVIFEICGTKDYRSGDALVKIIDREQINPSFIFTKLTSYRNRERYNRELATLIEKMDAVMATAASQGAAPTLLSSFQ